jgi:Na+-transporting NADH:ubiquinone oxidoreductase subunit B
VNRTYRHLLLASLPAALIGIANLGAQIRASVGDVDTSWQLSLLDALGIARDANGIFAAFVTGALYWLPLLAVSLVVAVAWGKVFARAMNRSTDPVWLPAAWLFALILPASVPLGTAAIALSFGLIFGCHVFGGTDRYLINPALLGVVFLGVGYPVFTAPDAALPGGAALSTWSLIAATGVELAQLQGVELVSVMLGEEVGAIGTTSALASLVGAAYLIGVRTAAPSIVVGGIAGSFAACAVAGGLPWTWQLAVGNFAFALAFVATDATTCPTSRAGQLLYGALFGALVIALRTADPSHPEGTWAALLLATLCIPLLEQATRAFRQTSRVQADV